MYLSIMLSCAIKLPSLPLLTLPIAFDCRAAAHAYGFGPVLSLCRECGRAACREAGLGWSSRRRREWPCFRGLRDGTDCIGSRY